MSKRIILTSVIALIMFVVPVEADVNISYSGNVGTVNITTYTPVLTDVLNANFQGSYSGYQNIWTGDGGYYGEKSTVMRSVMGSSGITDITAQSTYFSNCTWDEDSYLYAHVDSDTQAQLSQEGSMQGVTGYYQPKGLIFGATTSTGVTDLLASGTYSMRLEVGRGDLVTPSLETLSYLDLEGTADACTTAYLGSAGITLGEGNSTHSTGFKNTNPGGSNPLNGYEVSTSGNGVFEAYQNEIAPVYGSPLIHVSSNIWADSINTITSQSGDTGEFIQTYNFSVSLTGYGQQHGK